MAEPSAPAPSVVVGTAGHIDHGKTTLLRALTGIDADRLPEERRRGMTIDVGYAHLTLPDGRVVDFVDVPGHDRLVGNMLVGAGEIDAALLVVAADDGPNAQTLEHLELLDALGIRDGLAVITKADLAPDDARRAEVSAEVARLLARTTLAGAPVLVTSARTGEGTDGLRDALASLVARLEVAAAGDARGGDAAAGDTAAGDARDALPANRPRLGVDRVFTVRGRGTVVTGSLRGGTIRAGSTLRLLPPGTDVRVREVQVRGEAVEAASGGRTALLLAGVDDAQVQRGAILAADDRVVATSRMLVALRPPAGLDLRLPVAAPVDRDRLRLHLGTDQVDALVVRGPREALELPDGSSLAILRLGRAIAAGPGDRFALRRPSPGAAAGGGIVLDARPPRGISRRRLTPERAVGLATVPIGAGSARLELHGALRDGSAWTVAPDVAADLRHTAVDAVRDHHAAEPASAGLPLTALRARVAARARRLVTLDRASAEAVAHAAVDAAIEAGELVRDGDRARDPARQEALPTSAREAMDRLEAALAVAAPPALSAAARATGCPPDGVRALEAAGRIVRLEDDLAWATTTYRELAKRALAMAAAAPLTPAAFRDETGTSRRYVLVILEDLDRRGLLRRTETGHVLGPKTVARLRERAAAQGAEPP